MLAAQEDFSLGAFSIGHRVLTMQLIPGVSCKVTLGSCASMQNKEKHPHNTDRLDKLETTVPEPERQIPLPIVVFLSPRLNVIPFVGRNELLQCTLCISLLLLHCFRQIVILSLSLIIS